MHIRGNRQYSCKLKFKAQTFLDRNPRQVKFSLFLVFLCHSLLAFGKGAKDLHFISLFCERELFCSTVLLVLFKTLILLLKVERVTFVQGLSNCVD